jgi:hypothetical protein
VIVLNTKPRNHHVYYISYSRRKQQNSRAVFVLIFMYMYSTGFSYAVAQTRHATDPRRPALFVYRRRTTLWVATLPVLVSS